MICHGDIGDELQIRRNLSMGAVFGPPPEPILQTAASGATEWRGSSGFF